VLGRVRRIMDVFIIHQLSIKVYIHVSSFILFHTIGNNSINPSFLNIYGERISQSSPLIDDDIVEIGNGRSLNITRLRIYAVTGR